MAGCLRGAWGHSAAWGIAPLTAKTAPKLRHSFGETAQELAEPDPLRLAYRDFIKATVRLPIPALKMAVSIVIIQ